MSKALFRFLRGELNGYYVTKLNDLLNASTRDIKTFFCDFQSQQFELGKISLETLYNLGKFASIFLLRLKSAETMTALYLTDSHIVDGYEFSERGLYNVPLEAFEFFHTQDDSGAYFIFVRTTQEQYEDDIDTLTDYRKRAVMVGDVAVQGYISSEATDIFDSVGNVKPEFILATPPSGVAYSEFYGDNFLYLSEGDDSEADNLIRWRLSESEVVDGVEYSERGLFIVPSALFPDINTLATPELRSSLVGDEEVIGYISESETDVLDEEGNVKPEKILSTPPEGLAYSNFYGNQFLFLAESEREDSYRSISPQLYMAFFKAMQWIRYNGVSVASLIKVVELTCPDGLVKIGAIETAVDGRHLNVYYRYDISADTDFKPQRLSLLEYILQIKFKQVIFSEIA
jgi:hypothetical protein